MKYFLNRDKVSVAALAACFAVASGAALAQDAYPSRPITLIVPAAAGGSTDLLGRALAEGLTRELKQTVIVENKPGANGTVGVTQMKRAKPDGYTLTVIQLGAFRQPYLQPVQYDPLKDLTYISILANYNYAIAVRQDAKWQTIKELVDDVKADPDSIAYGTSGQYTSNHLIMVELARDAGLTWTHVPFKGDSESLTSLMGNHVQVVSSTNSVLPFAQSGQMRVLATAGETRPKDFADVPTLKEAGYDVMVASPVGVGGPAGMPADVVQKLDSAIAEVLKNPGFIAQAEKLGMELTYQNHEQYTEYAQHAAVNEKTIVDRMAEEVRK